MSALNYGTPSVSEIYNGASEGKAAYYGTQLLWNSLGWNTSTLQNNLLAFYRLNDNGSGEVSLEDTSGNNLTLVNNNLVSLVAGKILGAANFDNTQKSLYRENFVFFGLSEISFSFWLSVYNTNIPQCFLHTGKIGLNNSSGIGFYADPSNKIKVIPFANNSVTLGTNFFSTNTWYHIILTASRIGSTTSFSLYVNSSFIESKSGNAWFTSSAQNGLIIGRSAQGQNNGGVVDAVGVWNRVLSNTEISQLYSFGVGLEI
jgi:hypothetical protein